MPTAASSTSRPNSRWSTGPRTAWTLPGPGRHRLRHAGGAATCSSRRPACRATTPQLQTQENLGFDLGVDWTPLESLRISLTGFYEFFRNELVSQSPGGGPA